MIQLVIALIISFFVGFPFGIVISQAKGVNIQKEGSGNAGATNIWRTFGARWGILVFLIDAGKACLMVTVLYNIVESSVVEYLFPEFGVMSKDMLSIFLGSAVILGNVFAPEFFGFHGGKAVATSAGVMLGIHPGILLIGLGIFGATLFLSRMVSVSSLIASVAVIGIAFLEYGPAPLSYFTAGVVAIIIIRHIPNIKRIGKKEERKI